MANKLIVNENHWREQLEWLENWQDKYLYIMECGRRIPGINFDERNQENLVKGCQSQVWLKLEVVCERLSIKADSDALIVKGLIAIVTDIYDQQLIHEIKAYDHNFAKRLGLLDHLSPTRANGLHSILSQIIDIAHKS